VSFVPRQSIVVEAADLTHGPADGRRAITRTGQLGYAPFRPRLTADYNVKGVEGRRWVGRKSTVTADIAVLIWLFGVPGSRSV
jgi:hypothetical protein